MVQSYDNSIGQTFGLWGEMTPEQQQAWWTHFRNETERAGTIMFGEGTIHYPPRNNVTDDD